MSKHILDTLPMNLNHCYGFASPTNPNGDKKRIFLLIVIQIIIIFAPLPMLKSARAEEGGGH